MSTINTIPFHGHDLTTIKDGDVIRVAMRPIVDAIGLDWHAQRQRIKRHPVLSTFEVMITAQLPGDAQRRKIVTLPLEMLNGWLFGVDANRVKPEIRDTLLMYQRECFHVLFSYWHKGEAANPRFTTVDERTGLRDAVNLLVSKRGLLYPDAYRLVHHRFSVEHLDELTQDQLPQAIEYVHRLVLEGEFIAAQPQVFSDHDMSNLYCLLVHVDMICKRWAEYRIEDVLRLLKSPAAGQMCEHVGDARRLKNTLVRTRGDAMASARHRRGMSCNIDRLYT